MKFNDLLHRLMTREGGNPSLCFATRRVIIAGDPYILRQATVEDAPTLVEIERVIYGEAPWNAVAFVGDIKRPDRLYVVVETTGKVIVALVGGCHCTFTNGMVTSPTLPFPQLTRDGEWGPI